MKPYRGMSRTLNAMFAVIVTTLMARLTFVLPMLDRVLLTTAFTVSQRMPGMRIFA